MEEEEEEEETTVSARMESDDISSATATSNVKLQKPKKRTVNKETYNDAVERIRREFREEKEERADETSSLVIPSRDDVVASCASTSTLILMLGLGARFIVPKLAEMNPLTLGLIKDGVDWKHACLASALAVGVTVGRVAFMAKSEEGDKQFEQTSFDEFGVSRCFILRGVPCVGGGNAFSRSFNACVRWKGSRRLGRRHSFRRFTHQ